MKGETTWYCGLADGAGLHRTCGASNLLSPSLSPAEGGNPRRRQPKSSIGFVRWQPLYFYDYVRIAVLHAAVRAVFLVPFSTPLSTPFQNITGCHDFICVVPVMCVSAGSGLFTMFV